MEKHIMRLSYGLCLLSAALALITRILSALNVPSVHISWQRHERGQLSFVHGRRNSVLHDESDHSRLRVGQEAIRIAGFELILLVRSTP